MDARKRKRTVVLGVATGTVLIIAFLLLGPPKLLAKSDSPSFCAGCHVMEAEYEAWAHAGAHRRNQCVDCHLPNQNAMVHYVWKAIDGLKDVAFFYTGQVPERITLTTHGANVLQQNCVRCHEQTVMRLSGERRCWSCHRRISHKHSGAMMTI